METEAKQVLADHYHRLNHTQIQTVQLCTEIRISMRRVLHHTGVYTVQQKENDL